MKLIKPSEISGSILTLIDESDERIILVSPYIHISKWYKFIHKISRLKERKIATEVYVREDPENHETYRDLDRLGMAYKKIPHLHCKFYMNEKCGIVSSMNLLLSSEINSLEIGYATETWAEYTELLDFYQRYIRRSGQVQCATIAGQEAADLKDFKQSIREELRLNMKNSWFWLTKNELHLCTGDNNYTLSIHCGYLKITGWIVAASLKGRKTIPPFSMIARKIEELSAIKVDVHSGPEPHTLRISAMAPYPVKSKCIEGILKAEAGSIMETVTRFINTTEDLLFHE